MVARSSLRSCAFALAALLGPTAALANPYEAHVPNILTDELAFVGVAGEEAPPLPRDVAEFGRDLVASKLALKRTLAMIAARDAIVHRDPAFEILLHLAAIPKPRRLVTQ